jgi:hypothetical protein
MLPSPSEGEKTLVQWLKFTLSKRLCKVGVSLPSPGDGFTQFPKRWTMDKVHKPSDYGFPFCYYARTSSRAHRALETNVYGGEVFY